MRRTAVYLRQSKDRDRDELAVSRQREDCLKLCAARGWHSPVVYVDDDISATNGKRRPDYERLMGDVAAGKVGRIVAYHADRLYRQPRDLEDIIDVCNAHGVELHTASGELDLGTDMGRTVARILGAVAKGEVERKGARQKRAATQLAQTGRAWWGHRPFGFDADPNPVTGKWTVKDTEIRLCEDEAALIKVAYADVLKGTPLYTIAAAWNAAGVATPTGHRWRGSQVRHLLLCGRNAGLRELRGEVVGPGQWPAIVDEDVWRDVKVKLTDPKRRSGATRGRKRLLSGIATCGKCGHPLVSGITTTTKRWNYICQACHGVSRNGALVDALVVETVVRRLAKPDAADLVVDDSRPDLDALSGQRQILRDRLEALGAEYGDGAVPLLAFTAATKRIEEQLHELDVLMADASRVHVFEGVVGVGDVRAAFNGLDLGRRRTIVDALLTVVVHPAGRGCRTFKPESISLAWK